VNRQQLLQRIDKAWTEFRDSYAGFSDSQMTDALVTSTWTAKDVISHVTWWEEEALKYLPLIAEGRRPPRYSVMYGGIDAFNALMTEERRCLSLREVLERAAVADVDADPEIEAMSLIAASVRRELSRRLRITDAAAIREDSEARVQLEHLTFRQTPQGAAEWLLGWLQRRNEERG